MGTVRAQYRRNDEQSQWQDVPLASGADFPRLSYCKNRAPTAIGSCQAQCTAANPDCCRGIGETCGTTDFCCNGVGLTCVERVCVYENAENSAEISVDTS